MRQQAENKLVAPVLSEGDVRTARAKEMAEAGASGFPPSKRERQIERSGVVASRGPTVTVVRSLN